MQLYEKELLTEDSYLYIYGYSSFLFKQVCLPVEVINGLCPINLLLLLEYSLQGADLNSQQLAIVAVCYFTFYYIEWLKFFILGCDVTKNAKLCRF